MERAKAQATVEVQRQPPQKRIVVGNLLDVAGNVARTTDSGQVNPVVCKRRPGRVEFLA